MPAAKKAAPKKAATKKKAPPAKKKAAISKNSKNAPPPKALSVAAAGANAGSIPVDPSIDEMGARTKPLQDPACRELGANPTVHEDYGWLGNQVDISAGKNSNKYYRGQVIMTDSGAFAWTRWGRVGEAPKVSASALEFYLDVGSAIQSFEKKFKSKTGHAWQGNLGSYEMKNKKYTVIHEKHGGGGLQAAAVAAGLPPPTPTKYAAAKIKGKVAEFTKLITSSEMFAEQLKTMGIDTSKMPLGDISEQTVQEGFKALLAVEAELQKARTDPTKLAELCGNFYTYIPHDFGRQKAPLLQLGDIAQKKDMLNILSDVGAAVASQKKQRKKAKAKVEPAAIDTAYSSLSCSLRQVAGKELDMIKTYTDNTQGGRKCKVIDAFAVDGQDASAFAASDGIENRKLLWHGTNVAVVAAILKSGLRIMPHSGGRVGSGVYLASENGKSATYVTAQGNAGVMFLCEAALGTQRIVNSDGQVGWNETDPCSAHGADSVLAIGQTEPDPSKDTTIDLDGHAVVVPQGQVKKNPALKGQSSFSQSEYLVYNESQCRIRYVIKMHFEQAGGSWH